ncbi:hypothetical protein ACN27F_32590 [Solwaraspora sp. WMMB335]|uniref:hypothetical protein n=1 Tax=Solwaraspora sp. WMMB335 TaxID=3404118 RepID=UPI003B9652A0
MDDSNQSAARAAAGADSLEWNFTIMSRTSPWSVEQGMTQLLAHQNAEGFGPSLADAMQDDARIIHELGQRETPTAVAALRAYQAMSTVDTQRELARMHADRLVRQGAPEPPWAATVGRVRVDGCWWAHDQFGETAAVLCGFSYDGAHQHGILAVIDRAIGGGLIRELLLGMDVDALLDILHGGGDDGGELVSEPLDAAYARRLIEDAIATSDEISENRQYKLRPLPVAYRKMRGLTLARARALSDAPAPPEQFPTTVEIELLKRAFLGSDASAGLPTGEATGRAVDLLVTQFVEQAACHPLQLGPRRVTAVLGLPGLASDAAEDPAVGRILPDVARAWISWSATERGLPLAAAERLDQAGRQACGQLRAAVAGGQESV